MNLTTNYIVSQILIIIMYVFLASSYLIKNRKIILSVNIFATIINSVAYILLNAYTGLFMCIVALIRNLCFLIDEKKNGKRDVLNKKDIVILFVIIIIATFSTVFTYDGFYSLLAFLATVIYTYSVCQKKTSIYKILGIPTGILWMLYNFWIKSIFGFILEAILLIFSTTGYIWELKLNKKR